MPKIKSIARGLKAAAVSLISAAEASEFVIAGRKVVCAHCTETKFHKKEYNLTTDMRQGFGADGATILVCAKCQRIEWFYGEI
jgi:hypothetical protein